MAIPILSDIFGTKPQIAPFIPTILSVEQLKALTEDISSFGDITKLGDLYQNYMVDELSNLIPNFKSIMSEAGTATGNLLGSAADLVKGIIPSDVLGQVYRSSAYQNLMSGLGGAPAGVANTARNLGLTSLNLISQGAGLLGQAGNAAQTWANIAGGTVLNPMNFLITPMQQAQWTAAQRQAQQATKQEKFNVAASPNPIAKGLSDLVAYITAAYVSHGASLGSKPPAAATPATGPGPSDVTTPGYYIDPSTGQPASAGGSFGISSGMAPPTQVDLTSSAPLTASDIWNAPLPASYGLGGEAWNPSATSTFDPNAMLSLLGSPTGTTDFTSGVPTDLWSAGQAPTSPWMTGQNAPLFTGT